VRIPQTIDDMIGQADKRCIGLSTPVKARSDRKSSALGALREPLPSALERAGNDFFLDAHWYFPFPLLYALTASPRSFRERLFMCGVHRRAAFDHADAIDRARWQTQLATDAVARDHGMHQLRSADNRIYRASRDAQGAADASLFIDQGDP
jgi:hypothetical protein